MGEVSTQVGFGQLFATCGLNSIKRKPGAGAGLERIVVMLET